MLYISYTHSVFCLAIWVKKYFTQYVKICKHIVYVKCLFPRSPFYTLVSGVWQTLLFNTNIWIPPQILKIVDIAIFDSIISKEQ